MIETILRWFEDRYRYIGVDISEEELRAVEYDPKSKRLIDSFMTAPGTLCSHFGFKSGPLEKALEELKARFAPNELTRFNISIPAQFTVPKNIKIPKNLPDENIIPEIASQLPFPLESVYFDYIIREEGDSRTVIFIGIKRDTLDTLIGIFSQFGLRLGVVDTEYFNIYNSVALVEPDISERTIVLIHPNPSYSIFTVVHHGLPVSCSDSKSGYRSIFDETLVSLDLEWGVALSWLIGENLELSDSQRTAMSSALNTLVDDLCKNLNLLKHLPELKDGVDAVYLCGPLSRNLHFTNLLQEKIGIDLVRFDPLSRLGIDLDVAYSKALVSALRRYGDKYDKA
ncbi:MAG: pilus assembly protein PilM [Thermoplasmatales archaeon]